MIYFCKLTVTVSCVEGEYGLTLFHDFFMVVGETGETAAEGSLQLQRRDSQHHPFMFLHSFMLLWFTHLPQVLFSPVNTPSYSLLGKLCTNCSELIGRQHDPHLFIAHLGCFGCSSKRCFISFCQSTGDRF